MAELIRTQGYQAQVAGVPGAITPSANFGQRRPDIEFEARANYQQTLARALDRISETAFGFAEQMAPRAGAQFALENPLTQEQLDAMARGDMSTVDLGSPMNVFSATVRKARAIELSGHMEAEARQEMVSLYEKASRGELSTEEATGKIQGLLNAGSSSLAQVDPDAAFKYRASIATIGGKVIDEIGKAELKRRAIINEQKLSTDYKNILTGIGAYMTSTMPVNPETGEEWELMEVVGKIKEGFLSNAFAIGGLPVMQSYAERIDADIRNLQISTVTRELSKDEYFLDPSETVRRIYAGDLNDARQAIGGLAFDEAAIKSVVANFRSMVSDRRQQRREEEELSKIENNATANELMIEYFRQGTKPSRKRAIANEVAKLNVYSIDQLEKFLDPSAGKGDPYAQASLEFAIAQGEITDPEQLKQAAIRAGMNGEQYLALNRKLISGVEEDERRALGYIRQAAGVPDVRSAFVSKDDRHKLDKATRLTDIMNEKANLFRQENPGQTIPWQQLARDAEAQYTKIDAANAKKNQAREQLNKFVDGIKVDSRGRPNPKVPSNLVIDADTNVEDLVRRGIISQKDADYVQRRVNTLRGVSQ